MEQAMSTLNTLQWKQTGSNEFSAQCGFGTYAYWPEPNSPLDVFFTPNGSEWPDSILIASVYYEEDVVRDCQADYERRQLEVLA
jgi:hypothetical protein